MPIRSQSVGPGESCVVADVASFYETYCAHVESIMGALNPDLRGRPPREAALAFLSLVEGLGVTRDVRGNARIGSTQLRSFLEQLIGV